MKSHEMMRLVIEEVGTKRVASDLRVSTSLVYKWCADPGSTNDLDASGARNPLDRILELCQSTEDVRAVRWLCREVGGYFVESPDQEPDLADKECFRHTQEILLEFSSLLQVISESIAHEGRIDDKEALEIRRQWHVVQSQGEGFVRACERGHFDPERDPDLG